MSVGSCPAPIEALPLFLPIVLCERPPVLYPPRPLLLAALLRFLLPSLQSNKQRASKHQHRSKAVQQGDSGCSLCRQVSGVSMQRCLQPLPLLLPPALCYTIICIRCLCCCCRIVHASKAVRAHGAVVRTRHNDGCRLLGGRCHR